MKKILFALLIFSLILTGCASKKHYSSADIKNPAINGKTIIFSLTPASRETKIKKSGPAIGALQQQDNEKIFKEAIAELAKETQLDLRYSESAASTTEIAFNSDVTALRWKFGFSSASMESDIIFTDSNNKEYKITGLFKNSSGGSEEKHMHRSFKNAIFQLLQQYK